MACCGRSGSFGRSRLRRWLLLDALNRFQGCDQRACSVVVRLLVVRCTTNPSNILEVTPSINVAGPCEGQWGVSRLSNARGLKFPEYWRCTCNPQHYQLGDHNASLYRIAKRVRLRRHPAPTTSVRGRSVDPPFGPESTPHAMICMTPSLPILCTIYGARNCSSFESLRTAVDGPSRAILPRSRTYA